ncbi:hypothetical protein MMC30_002186 [Trapelia coarctata]|nr:hypothetical protein [Trapelia coarctata]
MANTDPQNSSAPLRWSVESALTGFGLNSSKSHQPTSPIPFLHLLERLKTTPREGWRRFGIDSAESISDHMYRMSIITMLAPKSLSSRLDIPRCTKMALIHDMAESIVGDITPFDGVSKEEKCRRETEAMDYLTKHLLGAVGNGGEKAGMGFQEVWQEYEDNKTLEANFVHDVDKLELILQMVEYEKKHQGGLDLGEFSRVAERIELAEVKEWCVELLRERQQYWDDLGQSATDLAAREGFIRRVEAERAAKP